MACAGGNDTAGVGPNLATFRRTGEQGRGSVTVKFWRTIFEVDGACEQGQ